MSTPKFRKLTKVQRIARTDQVRFEPGWLAEKKTAFRARLDPKWGKISDNGWLGFQNTRAGDWEQYEFRRAVTKSKPLPPGTYDAELVKISPSGEITMQICTSAEQARRFGKRLLHAKL